VDSGFEQLLHGDVSQSTSSFGLHPAEHQFLVSCFRFQNQKLETGNLKLPFRIAIPAPRREAQEELNTFKTRFKVSQFQSFTSLNLETLQP